MVSSKYSHGRRGRGNVGSLPKAVVGLTLLAAGFYVVTRLGLGGRQAQRPHAVSLSAPGGEAAKQPVYDSLYKYTALDIDGYGDLQKLYEKHKKRGLVVMGFPCNQFGRQEPHDEATIKQFVADKYGVTFPMFSKVEVKGPHAHPIFRFLTSSEKAGTEEIGWNFFKFLVDRNGHVVKRYKGADKPFAIEKDILELL
ncbi:glutathione peroxidase [Chloropicon primus]|nr:glutathione peroxidase [Chloropicon primus]